jgi:Domain of unknown function (DUF4157)
MSKSTLPHSQEKPSPQPTQSLSSESTSRLCPRCTGPGVVAPLLPSQRTSSDPGIQQRPEPTAVNRNGLSNTSDAIRFGHDFGRIEISSSASAGIQPKLQVNPLGGRFEQEANRVADQVMSMPAPSVQWQAEPVEEGERHQTRTLAGLITPLVQRQAVSEEESLQVQGESAIDQMSIQRPGDGGATANVTGMPGGLKARLEGLSGLDLSGIRVHKDSSKPAQINALAYTQGQNIHVAPGQEKHLPHEGWHVVQQLQGRVKPTIQANGVAINDDKKLEREAHVMGAKASEMKRVPNTDPSTHQVRAASPHLLSGSAFIQRLETTTTVLAPDQLIDRHTSLYGDLNEEASRRAPEMLTSLIHRPIQRQHKFELKEETDEEESQLVQRQATGVCQDRLPQIHQPADVATVQRQSIFSLEGIRELGSSAISSVTETGSELLEGATGLLSSATETGSALLEGASGLVGEGIDSVAESVEALINRIAPGLITFLREGVGPRLNNLLCSAVDGFVAATLGRLENVDLVSALESSFSSAKTKVDSFIAGIGEGVTDTLGSLLGPVVEAIEEHGLPFVRQIQGLIDSVTEALDGVYQTVAKPVVDFLGDVGGTVWEGLTGLADLVWKLTEPVRALGGRAWDWIKAQFGIAWESSRGAREWLVETASELWESLKETLEPVMGPLRVVGGILLLLSPMGPIIVLNEVILPLWEKLKWLWNNWNTDDVLVRAQEILTQNVLPGVISTVSSVREAMAGAASWLTDLINRISETFGNLLGAVGINRCLQTVTRITNALSTQFTRLSTWAQDGFSGLMDKLRSALDLLVGFLRPILEFLRQLVYTVANPLHLPMLIASTLWNLIPEKLKPPIVTFLLELIITFVKGASFIAAGLGPLGIALNQAVVSFLERLRDAGGKAGDEVKTFASNRIAQLAGGSLELMAGYAWGILRGVWDGLTDPFVLLYMLIQAVTGVSRYIYGLIQRQFGGNLLTLTFGTQLEQGIPQEQQTAPAASQVAPGATPDAPASVLPSPGLALPTATQGATTLAPPGPGTAGAIEQAVASTTGAAEEWQTSQEEAAGQQNANEQGLFALLSSAWDAILGAAGQLGARMADAFLGFLRLPDFELGNKVGWVAGNVIFEVALTYLTGGATAALRASSPVLRTILRLLDLGGEILGGLMRLLGSIRRPLMAALESMGRFLSHMPSLRGVLDRISTALRALFRYGDEAAGVTARAGREATEAAGKRVGREIVEEAGETAGARTAREATEAAGETLGRETAEEAAERASREAAEETGERAGRETAEESAEKAAQYTEALGAARVIAEANDSIDAPIPVVLSQLLALKGYYRWIDTFRAEPKGALGHYRLLMIASKTVIRDKYDTFDIEELKNLAKTNPMQARLELAKHLAKVQDMEVEEVLRLLDEANITPIDAIRRLEAIEELGNVSTLRPKEFDFTDHFGTIDRPRGAPPIESQIKGVIGEHRHALEVGSKKPPKASELISPRTLRELHEQLIKDRDLKKFMDHFPPEGVSDLKLMTAAGGERGGERIIDHAYRSGDSVIFRESKNVEELKLHKDLKRQIDKDIDLLRIYDDAIVEWRITGVVPEEVEETLKLLVKENKGRFKYTLGKFKT